jgi:hypothetical protein
LGSKVLAQNRIMSRNADYRREMGMDMPTPQRDMASERYSVTTKHHEPKPPTYMIVGGIVMVEEDDGWRAATAEEYAKIMGGVICMPSGCCEQN